ncbi:hypothetical protein DNTS_011338 [Danionella cerebrum]|uniref:TATA box-binding protein-associated factor RNA polymerase I subunit B n=1 Tax=Danionella cerebrum TaxID=2873325 RepID=A0A553MRZ3_9TELE|nr:hypothetical protein DNTS_011338 [Danionella translucida]
MDEELTDGYGEACGRCAAVDWGVSDEGLFFCKNCHNVIEKTLDVVERNCLLSKTSRISTIKKTRKNRKDEEREWLLCEAFQFILKHQAKALISLGVCMKFESEVLWPLWKRYLQVTRQAFTTEPVNTPTFKVQMTQNGSDSDSQSQQISHSEFASETEMSSSGFSYIECSESSATSAPQTMREKKMAGLMTMPRTLALCYLALLWVREAITLSDLLRMVTEGCIPYMDLHDTFPSDLNLYGADVRVFRVRHYPSYSVVHNEAVTLAEIINLPSFPTITQDCLLHPVPLSIRYLMGANLPGALHDWVLKVINGADVQGEDFLTFDPSREKPCLVRYDIQAVALIIVALKILFRLDDRVEWRLSKKIDRKKKKKVFSVKKWFSIVQPVLEHASLKKERDEAKREWKATEPLITSLKRKVTARKKRRVADHLKERLQRFIDSAPEQGKTSHSSFRFRWGKGEGSDGPSLFNNRLDCTVTKDGVKYLANQKYWHPELNLICGDHFLKFEPNFPRMYVWVLKLFSFILGVHPSDVQKEVLSVECRFLKKKNHPTVQ